MASVCLTRLLWDGFITQRWTLWLNDRHVMPVWHSRKALLVGTQTAQVQWGNNACQPPLLSYKCSWLGAAAGCLMCHKKQFCVVLLQQLYVELFQSGYYWSGCPSGYLIYLQSLHSDSLLPLWVHTFWLSHHCGKNRLCVRHVYLVILPLLLPYKLILPNLSSELSASAFFWSHFTLADQV